MKKLLFTNFLLFLFVALYSQNYFITFGGTGSSTTVDSVLVENLAQGTKLAMKGSDVLNLTSTTNINSPGLESGAPAVYPNPMAAHTELYFAVKEKGNVVVAIYDLSGKLVIQSNKYLQSGRHQYSISGLKNGTYVISIFGQDFNYSIKLVSENNLNGKAALNYASIVNYGNELHGNGNQLKSSVSTIPMKYNNGDRLKIIGKAGMNKTVLTDVPTQSKTLTFDFTPCTDADNNNYTIVKIGTQIWMAENLKTTNYRDGAAIPNVMDNTTWKGLSTGAYRWYNNNSSTYKNIYGAIYNWYAVNTGKLCPTGWHVPDDAEWTTLSTYLGSTDVAGGKMKETGTAHWLSPNTGATNESGFAALPGGYCGTGGSFLYMGNAGHWWSTSEYNADYAWYRYIYYNASHVGRSFDPKGTGYSVRCLRD